MNARILCTCMAFVVVAGCSALPERPVYRQAHYLKAHTPTLNAHLGSATAMSQDGQTLVVGIPDAPATQGTRNVAAGEVIVYGLHDGQWRIDAEIFASNPEPNVHFGSSVAISADGQTLAVGATGESSPALNVHPTYTPGTPAVPEAGAVYVFGRVGDDWALAAFVKASNTGAGDHFGASVALSANGSVLAVGAPGEGNNAHDIGFQFDLDTIPEDQANELAPSSGAVYTFENDSHGWSPSHYIKGLRTAAGDEFGSTIALSADGSVLAVGAPHDDAGALGIDAPSTVAISDDSGAVYTFRYADYFWTPDSYFKASDAVAEDQLGSALSLSEDGNSLLVGAPHRHAERGGTIATELADSGAAYLFEFVNPQWEESTYFVASNREANDLFGTSVAISADGSTAICGAPGESSAATSVNGDGANNGAAQSGAAYVFSRERRGWTQEAYLKSTNADAGDTFGSSVATASDGMRLAVGARGEASAASGIDADATNNELASAGAAYVFEL